VVLMQAQAIGALLKHLIITLGEFNLQMATGMTLKRGLHTTYVLLGLFKTIN
jgi:hypothetical protein